MEDNDDYGEERDLPPSKLFERLAQLSGYTWDQSIEPFHSVSINALYEVLPMLRVPLRAMITGMSLESSTYP